MPINSRIVAGVRVRCSAVSGNHASRYRLTNDTGHDRLYGDHGGAGHMRRSSIVQRGAFIGSVVFLSVQPALAGHFEAGLWQISTTNTMDFSASPKLAALMKETGKTNPVRKDSYEICVTQATAKSNRQPVINAAPAGCDLKVVRDTSSLTVANMTCQNNSTGSFESDWVDARHIRETMKVSAPQGIKITNITNAHWVKSDCGAVKPFGQ